VFFPTPDGKKKGKRCGGIRKFTRAREEKRGKRRKRARLQRVNVTEEGGRRGKND